MNRILQITILSLLSVLLLSACGIGNNSFQKSKSSRLKKVRLNNRNSEERNAIALNSPETELSEEASFSEESVTEPYAEENEVSLESEAREEMEIDGVEEEVIELTINDPEPLEKFNKMHHVALWTMIGGLVLDVLPIFTGAIWLWIFGTLALLTCFVFATIQKFVIAPQVHPDDQNAVFRRRMALASFIFFAGIIIISIIVLAIIWTMMIWSSR